VIELTDTQTKIMLQMGRGNTMIVSNFHTFITSEEPGGALRTSRTTKSTLQKHGFIRNTGEMDQGSQIWELTLKGKEWVHEHQKPNRRR
jgi:hypothetical protein